MTKVNDHFEIIKGYTFKMIALPGGTFEMGSDSEDAIWVETIHPVQVSPFYIGEFLVTQALWKAVMGVENNPSHFKGNQRPVEQVSWTDIVNGNQDKNGQPAFLDRLNELTKMSRPEGHHYRLPTEAEWEYAARANTGYTYAGSDKLKEVGWYSRNSHSQAKEVGLLRPNDFGLYDMSGNVEEWCHDWISNTYYQECLGKGLVVDPTGPEEGHYRVIRGGHWLGDPQGCRVSYRIGWHPTDRVNGVGFRLVLSPGSQAEL